MIDKGRTFFKILLIIIIVAVIGLGGYLAYSYISTYFDKKEASTAVDEFKNIITVAIEDEPENKQVIENTEQVETPTQTTTKSSSSGVRYRSFNVIGTIEIPVTGVKYPIVDDTTPAAMDSAIVFLYGPGLNQVGNSVIVGHNYRSGGFFGSNKKLEEGDRIFITDLSGEEVEYSVYKKYITTDSDFSYATRETNGKREISLSTCTTNASTRLIIWAVEV